MVNEQVDRALPIRPGVYRHFKGKEYEVLGIAKSSEDLEEYVVYRALYGENLLWIRPLKMFMESVVMEGMEKPRFEYIGSKTESF